MVIWLSRASHSARTSSIFGPWAKWCSAVCRVISTGTKPSWHTSRHSCRPISGSGCGPIRRIRCCSSGRSAWRATMGFCGLEPVRSCGTRRGCPQIRLRLDRDGGSGAVAGRTPMHRLWPDRQSRLRPAACSAAGRSLSSWSSIASAAILTVKPQTGFLLPLLWILRGRWMLIASTGAATLIVVGLSVAAFGIQPWRDYLGDTLPALSDLERQGSGPFSP